MEEEAPKENPFALVNAFLQDSSINALNESRKMLVEAGADEETLATIDKLLADTKSGMYHMGRVVE